MTVRCLYLLPAVALALALLGYGTGRSLQYGDNFVRLWRIGQYDLELSSTRFEVMLWGPFDPETLPSYAKKDWFPHWYSGDHAYWLWYVQWIRGSGPSTRLWDPMLSYYSGGRSYHGTWRHATMEERDLPGWVAGYNGQHPAVYLEKLDPR
jgi:hypothetical protein